MQGCLEFPSLVDLTVYLFELNEEVSLKLGIMVYDAPKTNVNKCYINMYFIHGMYKELNILIILMMKERKYPSIIYYVKIINSHKPKNSNYKLVESS